MVNKRYLRRGRRSAELVLPIASVDALEASARDRLVGKLLVQFRLLPSALTTFVGIAAKVDRLDPISQRARSRSLAPEPDTDCTLYRDFTPQRGVASKADCAP